MSEEGRPSLSNPHSPFPHRPIHTRKQAFSVGPNLLIFRFIKSSSGGAASPAGQRAAAGRGSRRPFNGLLKSGRGGGQTAALLVVVVVVVAMSVGFLSGCSLKPLIHSDLSLGFPKSLVALRHTTLVAVLLVRL